MPRRKPRTSRVLFRLLRRLLLGFATWVLTDATRPQQAAARRAKLPAPPQPPAAADASAVHGSAPARDPARGRSGTAPGRTGSGGSGRRASRASARDRVAAVFRARCSSRPPRRTAAAGNEVVKALGSSGSTDAATAVDTTSSLEGSAQPASTEAGAAAAVWLNRRAPDPTPPSRRLTPLFADQLATTARSTGSNGRSSSPSSAPTGGSSRRPRGTARWSRSRSASAPATTAGRRRSSWRATRLRRPHGGASALLQGRRLAGARHRPRGREARSRAPRPRRPAAPDHPGDRARSSRAR